MTGLPTRGLGGPRVVGAGTGGWRPTVAMIRSRAPAHTPFAGRAGRRHMAGTMARPQCPRGSTKAFRKTSGEAREVLTSDASPLIMPLPRTRFGLRKGGALVLFGVVVFARDILRCADIDARRNAAHARSNGDCSRRSAYFCGLSRTRPRLEGSPVLTFRSRPITPVRVDTVECVWGFA